jgi:transposase, IS30 family
MTYKQLSDGERALLAHFRRKKYNMAQMARELGRHRSTIMREFKRNIGPDGFYIVQKAGERTRGRRKRSRQHQYIKPAILKKSFKLLKEDYSPELISRLLRIEHNIQISHETIYKYIWKDKHNGGDLYKHLRQSSKVRWKRSKTNGQRGKLVNKPMIDDRPEHINNRTEFGHWEIDLVHGRGSKHCILTLVERSTGYLLIGKLKNKSVYQTNKRLLKMLRTTHYDVKTITADNGTEFHGYKDIQKKANLQFYFCHPYHSWERGTNENTN